jgi:hypothetical protein
VYCGAQRIDTPDAAKLSVLGGEYRARGYTLATRRAVDDAWATDGTTLFLQGRPVWDRTARWLDDDDVAGLRRLDVASIRRLDRWYAIDGRVVLVLSLGIVDPARDAGTFDVLGHGYARDRSAVWSVLGRLDARRSEFRVLGDGYATDGATVWWNGTAITDAQGEPYLLGGGWARDDRGILCGAVRVPADPETFVVVGASATGESQWDIHALHVTDPLWSGPACAIGRDRDRLWWGFAAGEAPASAVVIAHGYALTDDEVFHAGRKIAADAATFEAIGGGYARDAYRMYFHGAVTR